MTLPDGPRHVVAAGLAATVFLALFFGLTLVWWLALGMGVATYFALLLIVRRRPFDEEVMVGDRTSQADIKAAAKTLEDAAHRLSQAAETGPANDRPDLEDMASHVLSIRDNILRDPEDYRRAKRFVGFYLPNIVETVEGYVKLHHASKGLQQNRMAELSDRIKGFRPVIEKIDQACLENDFRALEVQVDVLAGQMGRG